jgi:hypothetical protein
MESGAVEALHRLILEECCWRPAFARYLHVRFTGLKRGLERDVDGYNLDRPTTAASPASESPRTSSTVLAR